MSFRAPSLIHLLGVLQQCGLTYAHLMLFVRLCRAGHTGPVVFHLTQGHILKVEGLQRLHTQWAPLEESKPADPLTSLPIILNNHS